jgi:hypothetical protein
MLLAHPLSRQLLFNRLARIPDALRWELDAQRKTKRARWKVRKAKRGPRRRKSPNS